MVEKKDNLSVNQMQKELDVLIKKKIQGKVFLRLSRKSEFFSRKPSVGKISYSGVKEPLLLS